MKNDRLLAVLAFNDTGAESDLTYASDGDIKSKFANQEIDLINPGKGSMQNAVKSINQGTSLWKLCLVLALIFLATEILLIRFYKNLKLNM